MLKKYIKLIAIILCGIGIAAVLYGPGSAEMSAYGIDVISVSHLEDDQIQVTLSLYDKDGHTVADDGEFSVQIIDKLPEERPSWLGEPIARVVTDPKTGEFLGYESIPEEEKNPPLSTIYEKTFKVKKSEFVDVPNYYGDTMYFKWESPTIKYSDFDRAAEGSTCWVIGSFEKQDGTILKYDKMDSFNY